MLTHVTASKMEKTVKEASSGTDHNKSGDNWRRYCTNQMLSKEAELHPLSNHISSKIMGVSGQKTAREGCINAVCW